MIKANVILECLNWKKKIKNPQKYLKKKTKNNFKNTSI
tara:strand:- start:156 stop:269 length:114 start_codon:yes stop_codon:yes gene_type:complete